MPFAYLLLAISVSATAGRNAISKKTAVGSDALRVDFFLSQAVLFFSAGLLLLCIGAGSLGSISSLTLIYGLIYGVLLVLSQWMLTLSLKTGSTAICSTVYSFGFILPTLSGAIFWHEPFLPKDGIGLGIVILVILLSIRGKSNTSNFSKSASFVPFILIAMLASGGLGIMQKVQQTSSVAAEKDAFLIVAFAFAALVSLLAFLILGKKQRPRPLGLVFPAATGLCFGIANLCNTLLAGLLKSAVAFPLQNISTILLSTLLGILIFRERLTRRVALILTLSALAVILFAV